MVFSRKSSAFANPSVWFAFAFALSSASKLLSLHSRELWLDETYSAYAASLPFSRLQHFIAGDVHPRLFSTLLWVWVRVAGSSPDHLRLFSVVVDSICVLVMFYFARRAVGVRAGAFAASLFAFSPTMFVYSLEVRSYMLFILVLVSLLYVHWLVAVEHLRGRLLIAGYGALAALLVYVHYLGILVLFGIFIHGLIASRLIRPAVARVAAAYALAAILFAPGVPLLLSQHTAKKQLDRELVRSRLDPQALSAGPMQAAATGWKTSAFHAVQNVASLAGFYPARSRAALLLLALPLGAACLLVLYLWTVPRDRLSVMTGTIGSIFLAAALAGGFSNHRYYLTLVPLVTLSLARAAQYWVRRFSPGPVSLVLPGLLLLTYIAGFYRQANMPHGLPWSNLVTAIQNQDAPNDTVVFDALYAQVPFDYFAQRSGLHLHENGFPIPIYAWWQKQSFKAWGSPIIDKADLENFTHQLDTSHSPHVWLVLYETEYYDPHRDLLHRLEQEGQVTQVPLPPDPDDHALPEPAIELFRFSPVSSATVQQAP